MFGILYNSLNLIIFSDISEDPTQETDKTATTSTVVLPSPTSEPLRDQNTAPATEQ